MSFRLACEAPDIIAAVAPVDFDCVAGGFGCANCDPGRPITEIQFRGTDDQMVDYGTETSGARANFAKWGEINQCTGSPEPQPEESSCQRYPSCADGVETILCTVQGGTHCGNYSSFGIADLAWGGSSAGIHSRSAVFHGVEPQVAQRAEDLESADDSADSQSMTAAEQSYR